MAPKPTTSLFKPFPRNSVNLVTGPTKTGKTYFVTQLLHHYKLYFEGPVNRIIFVQCNDRIQPLDLPGLNVEQFPLSQFDPDQLLEHDLVIIDDLQALTESIRLTISVCAHHYNLASLFIITHSLLDNTKNFELLTLCHRVFLFLKGTAGVRLLKRLKVRFFQDPEVQQVLESIVPYCQRKNQVLGLELNPLATVEDNLGIIGFSHLTSLPTLGYCIIYARPQTTMDYTEDTHHLRVDSELAQDFDEPDLPSFALVAVSAKSILASKPVQSTPHCSEAQQWNETLEEIETLIENYFKPNRWTDCKNLAREILRFPDYCIYTDGRYFHRVDKPKNKISLLDFLGDVTRRISDKEKPKTKLWHQFKPYVKDLRAKGVHSKLFKNQYI